MDKKVKRGIIIFILIAVIIAGFYAYRNLNLIIKEDIILNLDNNYDSIWLEYGTDYKFSTTAEINNYWLCKAECEQTIIDMHSGKYLFNETFYVTNNKKKTATATIIPYRGYGQSIYQYDIRCQNMPTSNCPAGNESYDRKSTLVVNNEPNNLQKEIITQSIHMFDNVSLNIAYSELNNDNATNILYNLNVNFPESLKSNTIRYNNLLRTLANFEKQILDDWNNDEYEISYEKISSIYNSSNELFHNTSALIDTINDLVNKHNSIVQIHRKDMIDAMTIKDVLKYYPGDINEFKDDAMTSLSLVNINTLKMNKLADYDSLLREAILEKENVDRTIRLFDSKINLTKSDYVDIYLADALSCSILGCNQTSTNYSLAGIDDATNRCDLFNIVMPRLLEAQNITKENRRSYNGSLSIIDDEEREYIAHLLNDMQANNSLIDSRISVYITLLDVASNNSQDFSSKNNFEYYSLNFRPMIDSLNNISVYCGRAENNFTFDNYYIQKQIIPEFVGQPVMQTIGQPIQKCCLYGECDECGEDKKNPLILLHGHSFNEQNSAYQSTDIFNRLEDNLVNDGYVSLGIWKPYSNQKSSILINAIFKPTYYITLYDEILGPNNIIGSEDILGLKVIQSKDESIEVYSDRLKDSIDNIRLITGSDKVDIVAHSMGGLVVRRYIQKYGPDSINKLILIATPNNGITDRVYSGCKLFGNNKECDEMHEGSDFLKLVNQNYSMPQTYLIIGKGCDMQGFDGDGVVTVDNAKLNNYKIYYIDGNCSGTSLLHNDILNRKEVSDRIKSIVD
jgi:hypothetical protein